MRRLFFSIFVLASACNSNGAGTSMGTPDDDAGTALALDGGTTTNDVAPLRDARAADTTVVVDAGADAPVSSSDADGDRSSATDVTLDTMTSDTGGQIAARACDDDPMLACGPRNERFRWSCVGRPCDTPSALPDDCKEFSPWLVCDCDTRDGPDSISHCFAGGSTFTVRVRDGSPCRKAEDCAGIFGGQPPGYAGCRMDGLCARTLLEPCASDGDCLSMLCGTISHRCAAPNGSSCLNRADCYSYNCVDSFCRAL